MAAAPTRGGRKIQPTWIARRLSVAAAPGRGPSPDQAHGVDNGTAAFLAIGLVKWALAFRAPLNCRVLPHGPLN